MDATVLKIVLFSAKMAFLMSASGCSESEPGAQHVHEAPPPIPQAFKDSARTPYAWLDDYDPQSSLLVRQAPPSGYRRLEVKPGTWAEWLRLMPVKPGHPDVMLFNGQPKGYQGAQALVFNIDVGTKDLQQCADAVMRLRGEYLFASGQFDKIHFNFTSGHIARYTDWRKGMRPVVNGNNVSWHQKAPADDSWKGFRNYMDMIFNWCGTASLSKELQPVASRNDLRAGDVFIRGGFPGHAVIVMDVAQNDKGEKVFLLAQSYMPAQEIHLLVNPGDENLSPWYAAGADWPLQTPEWTFEEGSLKRWGE